MTDAICSLWHRLYFTRMRDVLRGRLDASLDWRQTVALAELPDELAEAVRQVVGRTRLWRREKVDVAAELVAHFQDGLAAGRPRICCNRLAIDKPSLNLLAVRRNEVDPCCGTCGATAY